jgi:hypothetical protein
MRKIMFIDGIEGYRYKTRVFYHENCTELSPYLLSIELGL